MGGEDTGVSRHARWSIAALFVGSGLGEVDDILFREVGHVVHGLDLSLGLRWFQNDGVIKHDITIIGDKLATDRAIVEKVGQIRSMIRSELMTYSTFTKCLTLFRSAVLGLYSSSGNR